MTLLILAAGMGSRYGGLKQLDPMTEHGEFIIDFSIYDAVQAGFDKVVFIIKKENYEAFRETIGSRVEKHIKTAYSFQDLNDLPEGYSVPAGRTKPWGTTHATLIAEEAVGDDSFAVINADDFYGRDTFFKLAEHLKKAQQGSVPTYCMVGYVLSNTLSKNGSVSRGVCRTDNQGMLTSIIERSGLHQEGQTAVCEGDNHERVEVPLNTIVSMNCWGFTRDLFAGLKSSLTAFLDTLVTLPPEQAVKKECYLPNTVMELMNQGKCKVRVYPTTSVWHGVTYHEDKEQVKNDIRALIDSGEYPDGLWK